MKWILGMKAGLTVAASLLLLPAAASAQQTTAQVDEPVAIAMQTDEEADRDALRRFVTREDVQKIARIADVDLEDASAGILALEGERLSHAADQARAIENRIGSRDVSISSTALIIVLLLVLVVIIAAS